MKMDLKEPTIYSGRPTSNEARRPNVLGQHLLAKALSEGVTDPDELARLSGMRNATAVITTLDRLSMRKSWHAALAAAGIDLPAIAMKFKTLMDSENERIALNSVKALTASIGLDHYKDEEASEKGWEEALKEIAAKRREKALPAAAGAYEYVVPELPPEVKEKMRLDQEDGDHIFENKNT